MCQSFFAVVIFLLLIFWSAVQAVFPDSKEIGIQRLWPEAVCCALVFCSIALQMSFYNFGVGSHFLWRQVHEALGAVSNQEMFILAPRLAFENALRMATYVAIFLLSFFFGQDSGRARLILSAIALTGTLYAVYGLVMHFGGFEQVLWVHRASTRGDLSATLINRNNYATLSGLSLLCAVGLYQASLLQRIKSNRTGRDRLGHLLHHTFSNGAILLTGIIILLTALFLTHSRAGVISGLMGVFCLMYLSQIARHPKSCLIRLLVLCLPAGLLAVYLLSGEGWLHRILDTDLDKEGRFIMYRQVWQAVQLAPWGGYGAGSFAQLFPMFANELTSHWDKAHNDWLETIFDLGWPAALLWFSALVGLCTRCLANVFRRDSGRIYPMVGCSACILVGLHSFADFSLQVPAVAITFAAMLGVGVVQGELPGKAWFLRCNT